MGATNFVEVMSGYDNARDAYYEACEQATYEFGHDAYNGTISTTNGYTYLGEVDAEKLEEFIDKNIDKYRKWGKCGCVKSKDDYVFFGYAAC